MHRCACARGLSVAGHAAGHERASAAHCVCARRALAALKRGRATPRDARAASSITRAPPRTRARRSIGYYDQAMRLMGELRGLIENHERAMGKEYEARLSAQHQARQHLEGVLRLQQQEAQPGQPGPGQQGQGEGSEVQQNESSKRD
jgi:hypothetical protein